MSRYISSGSPRYHANDLPPACLIERTAIPVGKEGKRISSLPSFHSMSPLSKLPTIITTTASTTDEPPPPYNPLCEPTNPGFCEFAFRERLANRVPGGGMKAAQYFEPCKGCSFLCGDEIPAAYHANWRESVDPSVNFRWESHVAIKEPVLGGLRGEMLGCWICWEYEQVWVKPMVPEDWYMHMRKHFRVHGYRGCRGKTGAIQRRRNCKSGYCPKIHS
jgi:hypothetical protein